MNLTLFLTLVNLFITQAFAGTPPPGNVLPDLVEKVSPGVANISSTRFVKQYVLRGMPEFFGMFGIPEANIEKQSSLGSGFLIDMQGYILTNNHVIENASEVIVTFLDKRRFPAKIVGRDKALDLALLQLKGGSSIPNLKPCNLGLSEKVRIGESVFAIGNPFGLSGTVTAGIVSAKNRSIGIGPFDDFLQTDASINFGNSGGPLFNLKGEVVGINTAINAQGQGLGFAIPIDEAKSHLESLKKHGYIVRAWLGILGEAITPALQYYYDLPVDHGVVVVRLSGSGPSAKAGLKQGDILIQVNGQNIKERGDVQRALQKVKPGQKVSVRFNRKGKALTKELTLTAAPDTSDYPEGVL
ncbi:MAG: trypsin-like peptidase domain-containing protein [Bdellovibrionota bacterium]